MSTSEYEGTTYESDVGLFSINNVEFKEEIADCINLNWKQLD